MSLERLVAGTIFRPLVIGALASIIGCASPSGGKGLQEACGSDFECSGEYVCEQQKCVGGSGASCGNDFDCSGKLNCEQGKCVAGNESGSSGTADVYSGSGKDGGSTPSGTPLATQKTVSGVGITSGNTNSNGQVLFIDSGNKETVTITVKDKNNSQAISGAGVTFIDGNGFELFQVYKKGYVPALGVYAHNSEHEITLVNENYTALTIFEYYQNKNPDEYYALDKYVQWAGNNYLYMGCYTKEEMKKADEWGLTGVSYFFGSYIGGAAAKGLLSVINTVLDKLSFAEKNGWLEKYPDEAYQVYQAANFTVPQQFKGMKVVKEICNDGLDNDCDKYIDGKDSDCKTISNCTSHSITVCNNNNVQWKDSCGKLEEVVKQCSTSQTCENSQCVDDKPSCTPQYSKICSNGDVYWEDSCGNLGNVVESCMSDQTCESGKCVDNKPTCTPQYTKICSTGDVYWQDSCGTKGSMAQDCKVTETCIEGACFYWVDFKGGEYWYSKCGAGNFGLLNWEQAKACCEAAKDSPDSPVGWEWTLPTVQQFKKLPQSDGKGVKNPLSWTSENCNVKFHTAINKITFSQGCYDDTNQYLVKCIKK